MSRISPLDIKIFLWVGYAFFFLLAIAGPLFVDSQLASHVQYPGRTYPNAIYSAPIFIALVVLEAYLLKIAETPRGLLFTVGLFLICTLSTTWIFRPEFPHGNIVSVAVGGAFLSSITIFVWWMCNQILSSREENTGARETIEYLKSSLAFVRQATFAGLALFGAFFFTAYSTGFSYVESTVTPGPTSAKEILLLKANIGFQIAFYGIYSLAGILRYFLQTTLRALTQFQVLAARTDGETIRRAEIDMRRAEIELRRLQKEEEQQAIKPLRAAKPESSSELEEEDSALQPTRA